MIPKIDITNMRYINKTFYIDTNRINARQKEPYMNQLEKWRDDGVIKIMMPESVYYNEIMQEKSTSCIAQMRKRKTIGTLYSMAYITTEEEEEVYSKIRNILFPNCTLNKGMEADILSVFIASKYNYILITNDGGSKRQPGGILGHNTELLELGVKVMSDRQAVELVREKITKRDRFLTRCNEKHPEIYPLPDWVGKD